MTEFETFVSRFKRNPETFREEMKRESTYDFAEVARKLQCAQNNLSGYIMVDLFGEQLGSHLFEKFVTQYNRNLLLFMNALGTEEHFFLMHQFNTNTHHWRG